LLGKANISPRTLQILGYYVGESIIFRNMCIFFAVGDTADWACHDIYGLSFLKLWYRFTLDSAFMSYVL